MTLADIPAGLTVFVDANIFVYYFRRDPVLVWPSVWSLVVLRPWLGAGQSSARSPQWSWPSGP